MILIIVHQSVIPAIGFFCSGGRCVIVSMKQHGCSGVAKVVNPLGTVVTVHLDDVANDVDCNTEEIVIHENCDEALFRPVVASKSLHYADSKSLRGEKITKTKSVIADNICTKNLKSTTEVAYKIFNKELDVTVKSGRNKKTKELTTKNEKNHKSSIDFELINSISKQSNKKCESEINHSGAKKASNVKSTVKMYIAEHPQKPDDLTCLQHPPEQQQQQSLEDLVQKTEDDDVAAPEHEIFSTSNNKVKVEHFEDAQELCDENLKENILDYKMPTKQLKNEKQKLTERETHSSSEDNVIEEKTVIKKARKPKPKLGVRIPSVLNKDNTDEKSKEECVENLCSDSPRKTWSSIVAKKPKELINFESEPLANNLFADTDLVEISNDDDFLQSKELEPKMDILEKLSDDEKINGSQTETTESDDSAKIAKPEIEEKVNSCQLDIFDDSNNQIKTTKRKSKKKKK